MADLVFFGLGIILAGFLVVFVAAVMADRSSSRAEQRSRVRGGGVIMIGPIPIVFGSDARWASVAIVLTIVLILIMLFSGV